jgi:hypothetical protein
MTANDDLERRIADHYAAEVPHRAPDRVLRAALMTIDTTRQRRVLVPAPWRFPTMHAFTRVAVAAVAAIAIGALGLAVLRPGSGTAGGPAPSTSPSAEPTRAPMLSPTALPIPDPSSPPPLGGSFTSAVHGISISYPTGWTVDPATEPLTAASEFSFGSPGEDHIYDPVLKDHLFLALTSRPLAGKAGDAWVTDFMHDPDVGCGASATQPITLGGSSGLLCPNPTVVAVWAGDRGYTIRLYTSEAWLDRYYNAAWFRSVLDTVQLHPADALRSAAPSTRGSASPKPS